ncbi:hypothetical protein A9Q81_27910 [Gammaproteobacteria bacterium 42_54_T18]|nr:hypothetical protein A9Q81_27910 [Gammaproteobacteria bacterium 42_54_T18]
MEILLLLRSMDAMKISRTVRFDNPNVTLPKNTPIFRLSKNKKKTKVFLVLKGFETQGLASSVSVAEILNQLPIEHLQGLNEIVCLPNSNKREKAAFRTKKISALWNRYFSIFYGIEIYRVKTIKEFYWALFHELGHYVMDVKIKSVDKKLWVTSLHKKKSSVSEYANRNAHEDFAETYACFVLEPERLLQCDRKRYLYMANSVFGTTDIERSKYNNHKGTLDLTV